MKTNDIKKGTNIRTKQLGVSVSGIMMDNARGNTRLIKTNTINKNERAVWILNK